MSSVLSITTTLTATAEFAPALSLPEVTTKYQIHRERISKSLQDCRVHNLVTNILIVLSALLLTACVTVSILATVSLITLASASITYSAIALIFIAIYGISKRKDPSINLRNALEGFLNEEEGCVTSDKIKLLKNFTGRHKYLEVHKIAVLRGSIPVLPEETWEVNDHLQRIMRTQPVSQECEKILKTMIDKCNQFELETGSLLLFSKKEFADFEKELEILISITPLLQSQIEDANMEIDTITTKHQTLSIDPDLKIVFEKQQQMHREAQSLADAEEKGKSKDHTRNRQRLHYMFKFENFMEDLERTSPRINQKLSEFYKYKEIIDRDHYKKHLCEKLQKRFELPQAPSSVLPKYIYCLWKGYETSDPKKKPASSVLKSVIALKRFF